MCKLLAVVTAISVFSMLSVSAQPLSPNGVKTLSPTGAIKPTGTWSLGTRAGDFIFVAGMRGIDPVTNQLVQGDEARIRQGFLNMKLIAESEGRRCGTRPGWWSTSPTCSVSGRWSTKCRRNCGGRGPIRRAPSSRSTGSIRTTFSRSRGRSTPRSKSEGSPAVGPWGGGPT